LHGRSLVDRGHGRRDVHRCRRRTILYHYDDNDLFVFEQSTELIEAPGQTATIEVSCDGFEGDYRLFASLEWAADSEMAGTVMAEASSDRVECP
jgi:hypothetical protein